MSTEHNPVYADQKTRDFIHDAMVEKAHEILPHRNITETGWAMQKALIVAYYGSPGTLQEIADLYNVTRSAVHQRIHTGMRNLWENCSDKLKQAYPFSSIPSRKSLSLRSIDKMSRARGGSLAKVGEMLKAGQSVEEIAQVVGINPTTVKENRRRLSEYDDGISYKNPQETTREIMRVLSNPDSTTDVVRQALSQVNRWFLEQQASFPNPLVTPLTDLLLECQLRTRDGYKDIAKDLEKADIPVGIIRQKTKTGTKTVVLTYYFIASMHADKAKEALWLMPTFQKLREKSAVKQLTGPKVPFPSALQLHSKRDYRPVWYLLHELNISLRREAIVDEFSKSPVPIFLSTRKGICYYQIDKEEALRKFVRENLTAD